MEKLTLFDLGQDFLDITAKIEAAGGEVTTELEKIYDLVIDKIFQKKDGYIQVASTIDAKINEAKEWKYRMDSFVKTMETHKEKLQERLKDFMLVTGMDKMESVLGTVSLQTSLRADVYDMGKLPKKYRDTNIVISPKKREILNDLKEGKIIPGAQLQEKQYVKIYKKGKGKQDEI